MKDAALSYDGKELAPLARRVPQVKATGSVTTDTQLRMQRNAMINIIDAISKRPKLVMPLFAYLTANDLEADIPDAPQDADAWKGGYRQLDRIPRGWLSAWLLQYASRHEISTMLSEDYLCKLARADSDGINTIFFFATQLLGTMPPPPPPQM